MPSSKILMRMISERPVPHAEKDVSWKLCIFRSTIKSENRSRLVDDLSFLSFPSRSENIDFEDNFA